MNLKDVMQFRYSTKEFDPEKKISAGDMDQLKHILRYSPSSVNSQPWHFIIASGEESKQRVAKGAQGTYQFNEQKILDASHVVVLCARASIDEPTYFIFSNPKIQMDAIRRRNLKTWFMAHALCL